MTTTSSPTAPNVAPPPGAEPDVWEGTTPMPHRVVYTEPRCVLNRTGDHLRSPVVVAQAIQWADGFLDDGLIEPPSVSIESSGDHGLTSAQARELAAAILEAADEIDGWAGRTGDPAAALATARQALQVAYQATRLVPGNSGDYVHAAIDSIDDAIEGTR